MISATKAMVHPDSFAPWQLNYRSKDAPSVSTTIGRNGVAGASSIKALATYEALTEILIYTWKYIAA